MIKMDVYVFSESGTVIVSNGFGISECFQDRVSFENLLFYPGMFATYRCEVLKNEFGAFRFTCT